MKAVKTVNKEVTFFLDGHSVSAWVEPHARLIDLLRDQLGQTGTKEGCGEGECGACTVIVERRPINACLYPALEVEGKSVRTVQGLAARGRELTPVQRAFVELGGAQCGFCSPGMIMTATALLESNPQPTDQEIRKALVGNLCRCTGYVQIIESVQRAAAIMSADEDNENNGDNEDKGAHS